METNPAAVVSPTAKSARSRKLLLGIAAVLQAIAVILIIGSYASLLGVDVVIMSSDKGLITILFLLAAIVLDVVALFRG